MKVLKNGRSELFHMNGEALKNLITAAGYSCKSLSEKMEFNSNYLAKCIKKQQDWSGCCAEAYGIQY